MGLVVYIVAWVEAYLRTKWHLNPSSRSATTEMGRKLGRLLSSFLGEDVTGSNRHNVAWSEAYLRTKWHLDPSSRLATTDMGQKLGGGCALFGGAGSPSNTMWPGPRPITVPSFILIHPTVWPQYTNVRDRTDRQTENGPIAQGEPFYKRSLKNGSHSPDHAHLRVVCNLRLTLELA